MNLFIICVLSFLCSYIVSGCATFSRYKATPSTRYVRVAVVNGANELTLSIPGTYSIKALHAGRLIKEGPSLKKTVIKPTTSGFIFGEEPLKVFGIRIESYNSPLTLNNLKLGGAIELVRQQDNTILAINHINIEDYLKGVLYHESSHYWSSNSLEALKALAISARTYALSQDIVNLEKDFGLMADIFSQVYKGKLSERGHTNRAIELTSGRVLTYRGELFPAYHHSTCGGHTEDAAELWKTNIMPLKGAPCNFCEQSPHYRWRADVPVSKVESTLKMKGYRCGKILKISAIDKNRSNRIRRLIISGAEGRAVLSAKEFRQALGVVLIRSTNFEVTINGDNAIFRGSGWGHGVGLCQWGAYGMAQKGYTAEQILKYYYPGAEITNLLPFGEKERMRGRNRLIRK